MSSFRRRLRHALSNRVLAWEITVFQAGRFYEGDRLLLGYEEVRVWRVSHERDTLYVY